MLKLNIAQIKNDLFGGLTAGIVALPLALAFGVQSGLGAIYGLYGAMILGMIAAIMGGTQTQVSGPTGPMTVVTALVVASAIKNISENANLTVESSLTEQDAIKINLNSFNIAVKKLIELTAHSQERNLLILSKIDNGISISVVLNQLSLEKGGNIFITNPEKTDISDFYINLLICFLIFGHHGGLVESDLDEKSLKLTVKLPNNPQEISFLQEANSESLENAILSSMLC